MNTGLESYSLLDNWHIMPARLLCADGELWRDENDVPVECIAMELFTISRDQLTGEYDPEDMERKRSVVVVPTSDIIGFAWQLIGSSLLDPPVDAAPPATNGNGSDA